MQGFLSDVTVSQSTGIIFQVVLLVASVFVSGLYIIFMLRYRLIKDKAPLEQLYFYFITINVLGETIRIIDPFSMNGIYSYEFNRLLNFFLGGFLSTCLGIMISDTLSAILARIDKESRDQSMRYVTIISLIITTLGVNFCVICILVYIIGDGAISNEIPNISGKIGVICAMVGVLLIVFLIWNDIKKLKVENRIGKANNDASKDDSIEYRAKKRLLLGLYLQLMFVVSIVITFIFELLDGAYAVDRKQYFVIGLWYSIAFRVLPLTLLYTQWIEKGKLSDSMNNGNNRNNEKIQKSMMNRQTTVGYLRDVGNDIDLLRVHTFSPYENNASSPRRIDGDDA